MNKKIAQNDETPSPSAAHNLSGKMVSRLKLVSVVMGVLIIVCVIALIYGITQKAGDLLGKPAGDIVSKLELEAGAKLHSIAGANDGGLWLWVKMDGKDQLLRLDAAGKPMGQVEIESK